MIIGLSGLKRHGKGTCGGVLVREYGFVQVDFTDALNEMLMVLNPAVGIFHSEDDWGKHYAQLIRYREAMDQHGYDGAKERFPEIVRLMQVFGTEVGRKMIDPELWTKQWSKRVDPLVAEGRNVVVTNVRFDNEVDVISEVADEFDALPVIWKVVRPGYIHDPEAHKHTSEAGISEKFVDAVITASTVLEIEVETRRLIEQIL